MVHTRPYFFPIKRFLRLKEPQKGAIRGFLGQTIRSGLGFKTMRVTKTPLLMLYVRSTKICSIVLHNERIYMITFI